MLFLFLQVCLPESNFSLKESQIILILSEVFNDMDNGDKIYVLNLKSAI